MKRRVESGGMDGNDTHLQLMLQRDKLADAFEQAWRRGPRPRLQDYVGDLATETQREMLQVLLPIEWEYRLRNSEIPTLTDYQSLRPAASDYVASVCSQVACPTSASMNSTRQQQQTSVMDAVRQSNTSSGIAIGDLIGDYEIIRELGKGGMGIVYLARNTKLQRLAALKFIRAGVSASGEESRRFLAEATAAAQLDHPGIVSVYEVGSHLGLPFLALAFVDGPSLWQKIHERPFEPKQAATLMVHVASAVHFAHQRGIVHRDLKPHNILLSADGQPRVSDFGLARFTAVDSSLTATGQLLGTPSYMPPEQAKEGSHRVGPEADVYALGATLYCALTGHPPFQAANVWEVLRLVQEQDPVSLRTLNKSLPRDLETICLKCLRKDPLQRYRTADELADDLQRYLDGRPILARPVGTLERSWRWCRRNPMLTSLMGFASGLLIAIASISTWAYYRQRELTQQKAQLVVKEQAARKRAQQQLYYSQIARAAAALDAENFAGASEALDDQSPVDLRGFEYWMLQARRMGTPLTLVGAGTTIYSSSFSRDGTRLAVGSVSNEIGILDVGTGRQQQHLQALGGTVTAVECLANDELISVSLSGNIVVWNLKSGAPSRTWEDVSPVFSACLSPDGNRLATCSGNGQVNIWNIADGSRLLSFKGHQGKVRCVVFDPSGERIVSGASSGPKGFEILQWNSQTGEIRNQASGGQLETLENIAYHPSGNSIATVTGSIVKTWAADDLSELSSQMLGDAVTSICWSPDGTQLSTTALDGTIAIWNAKDWKKQRELRQHAEHVRTAKFSSDGYRLVSASGNLRRTGDSTPPRPGQIKVWNLREPVDGSRLAVDERDVDPQANYLNAVAFQPSTGVIATGGWRRVVRLVDVATGHDVCSPVLFGSVVMSLEFHPRQPLLIISGTISSTSSGLMLYDTKLHKATSLSGHAGRYCSARLSPDGKILASWGDDQVVKLWDCSTGKELSTLRGHTAPVEGVRFSLDGTRLSSFARRDQGTPAEVKSWDVHSGAALETNLDEVGNLGATSPDGKLVAARDGYGVIRIWNVDGTLRHTLRGHLADIPGLEFSSDGKRLFSASRDGTIRIWDPWEGIEVLRIASPDSAIDVALSSDQRILACATQLGTVRVWDARSMLESFKLAGHSAAVQAYGFAADGTVHSRDEEGLQLSWKLPSLDAIGQPNGPDPSPFSDESPDGQWKVEIDRLDANSLRATKLGTDPSQPWRDAMERYQSNKFMWHSQDAAAAEKSGDWFAAVFHLTLLVESQPNDSNLRQRLDVAEEKLRGTSSKP